MYNEAIKKKYSDYEHVSFHHQGADGYITLAKKDINNGLPHRHYKASELAEKLTEWTGEDVYFSQNTFYKPGRKVENIRELRALYIDLDFYQLDYKRSWVLGKLEYEYFGKSIPNPNIIINSGRGAGLIWLIDPARDGKLNLWRSLQDRFYSILEELGADPNALDPARIFRVAGSINSKNGAQVTADIRHEYRYSLNDLIHDYLPELDQSKKNKRGRPSKIVQLFNTYGLHIDRYKDLLELARIRNYKLDGYREKILFLYRYWQCCHESDAEKALQETIQFNSKFSRPLPLSEVKSATRSAQTAWEARSNKEANEKAIEKGYPGAGYNLKNTTIIEWFNITAEEQIHLKSIIGAREKRRRDKVYQEKKRRERGDMTRLEYEEQQTNITDNKMWLLQKAMERYPKAKGKELAEMLQVSPARITQLKNQLKIN